MITDAWNKTNFVPKVYTASLNVTFSFVLGYFHKSEIALCLSDTEDKAA